MKNYVRLISPAKINLVLAVGASREDGFHEVHTIMHSLALHDSLTMRRFEEDGEGLGFEHEGCVFQELPLLSSKNKSACNR